MAAPPQSRPANTGMPRLGGAPIDLSSYRAHCRADLIAALDSVPAPPHVSNKPRSGTSASHALVLDPSLSGPLGLVAEVKEFKEHGVDKIYHLLSDPLQTECASIIYFIRPQLRLAEQVAAQVRAIEKSRSRGEPPKQYTLFFVPRRSMLCEKVLEDEGVYGLLTIRECALELFVLEDDVLSLEQPSSFRDCFLDRDRSVIHTCAAALARLQAVFGTIPTVRGKGECAQLTAKMMQQMLSASVDTGTWSSTAPLPSAGAPNASLAGIAAGTRDDGLDPGHPPAQIAELLLLDRDVDLVTPLCTELTYEGLIHQVFGISHGYVDLEPEIAGLDKSADGSKPSKLVKRELNNNDPLYAQIRNLNFGDLGPLLNRLARGVSSGYEERHQAQTVSQIRDYMKKLNKLQQEHKSLATHVALAERIQQVTREESFHRRLECEQETLASGSCSAEAEAFVEDLIASGEPLPSVLRLLCLLSVVPNGLKPKSFAHLQAEVTHAYGFDKLALTWSSLAQLGLLRKHEGRAPWTALKKSLKLVVDNMPEHDMGEEPHDLAYVYAGYAPLSVRLLHAMLHMSVTVEEQLRLLPGPYFFFAQPQKRSHTMAGADPRSAATYSTGLAAPLSLTVHCPRKRVPTLWALSTRLATDARTGRETTASAPSASSATLPPARSEGEGVEPSERRPARHTSAR